MISFLFEQYGYYPENFIDNSFIIDGWKFKLIQIDFNDDEIQDVCDYCSEIRMFFFNKGPFIIKTRFNKIVSYYDNKKYVLVSFYNCAISIAELNSFHFNFKQDNKKNDLTNMLMAWQENMFFLENSCLSSLRVDSIHYQFNVKIVMFCLGMAQNAVQYLSECILDYGKDVEKNTITHKRLKSLESDEVLNPFNLVIDHPTRDLIELYRNNLLSFEEFINVLKYYELDSKAATICMARLVYPCEQIDLLEKKASEKNFSFKSHYNVEKEYMKIKKVYKHFKTQYNIRPIEWLEY